MELIGPATDRQLSWINYHMRRQLEHNMPDHWEEKVLANGMTQKVNQKYQDCADWARKNLTKGRARDIISLWSDDKESESWDLLVDSGLPLRTDL